MQSVGYLGPEGTFSHQVAKKRFGAKTRFVPCSGIHEIFEFIKAGRGRLGVVPVENSSGGTIYETIDGLVENAGRLHILESLSLNVRLALLGHRSENVRELYSHFVPLQHCQTWIRKNLPGIKTHRTASTAAAAERAAEHPSFAALATRDAARRYGLDILQFPVETSLPNITDFLLIGPAQKPAPQSTKTSLLVMLENRPGSLFDFLAAFKDANIDLTRLLSRPIIGQPQSYLFVVDIKGTPAQPAIRTALRTAHKAASRLIQLGVYPVRKTYAS